MLYTLFIYGEDDTLTVLYPEDEGTALSMHHDAHASGAMATLYTSDGVRIA